MNCCILQPLIDLFLGKVIEEDNMPMVPVTPIEEVTQGDFVDKKVQEQARINAGLVERAKEDEWEFIKC